jgi:DNA-binding XRE family transcriptional regulator
MPNKEEVKLRKVRAQEWKMFRRNNLFTQKRLAEMIGVSRRTIQQIENMHITPHPQTLRQFANYKRKFDINADLDISA